MGIGTFFVWRLVRQPTPKKVARRQEQIAEERRKLRARNQPAPQKRQGESTYTPLLWELRAQKSAEALERRRREFIAGDGPRYLENAALAPAFEREYGAKVDWRSDLHFEDGSMELVDERGARWLVKRDVFDDPYACVIGPLNDLALEIIGDEEAARRISLIQEEREAPTTKVCPDCAEEVKAAARRCRFCGYAFSD
jgi:hypothetical protein